MRVNLADARITGNGKVGGIAGYAFKTTLEDCTVAANVCIHYVNSQSDYHGGIVGFCSNGAVQRCISHVTFTAINDCEFYGAIAGEVCGSKGKVKDCIAIGATVPSVGKRGAIAGHICDFSPERNYYYNCTVGGNTTGVGVSNDPSSSQPHDITAKQGAQALYRLTLPSDVSLVRTASATLPGTGNATYTTGADTRYFNNVCLGRQEIYVGYDDYNATTAPMSQNGWTNHLVTGISSDDYISLDEDDALMPRDIYGGLPRKFSRLTADPENSLVDAGNADLDDVNNVWTQLINDFPFLARTTTGTDRDMGPYERPDNTATALSEVSGSATAKTIKVMQDGRLVIMKNGRRYNALGQTLR